MSSIDSPTMHEEGSDYGLGFTNGFNELSLLEFGSEQEMDGEPSMMLDHDIKALKLSYREAKEEILDLQKRLKLRTVLLEDIRTAYLRDIVTVKHVLSDIITEPERCSVLEEYKTRLPSVDLRQPLSLYGPTNAQLRIKTCDACGGNADVVISDSDQVDRLLKANAKFKEREERLRITIASLDVKLETSITERLDAARSHSEEKRFLYAEMKKIKAEAEVKLAEITRLSTSLKTQREEIHSSRIEIIRLEGQEKRMFTVEKEAVELKVTIQEMQTFHQKQEIEMAALQSALLSTNEKSALLMEAMNRAEEKATSLEADLKDQGISLAKFRDMSMFLEKTLEAANKKIGEMEVHVSDMEEEKKETMSSNNSEIEGLEKALDLLRDELRMVESGLRESRKETAIAKAEFNNSQKLVLEREETIKLRNAGRSVFRLMGLSAHFFYLFFSFSSLYTFFSLFLLFFFSPN